MYYSTSYAIYLMSWFVFFIFVTLIFFLVWFVLTRPFVWYQNHKRHQAWMALTLEERRKRLRRVGVNTHASHPQRQQPTEET